MEIRLKVHSSVTKNGKVIYTGACEMGEVTLTAVSSESAYVIIKPWGTKQFKTMPNEVDKIN